jgi:leucyl/phenylalanyl-tRNA--protein transferase
MIAWLKSSDPPESFPPLSAALQEPDGLLAAGGDLQPQRLLAAYRRGIFPWFSPGQPILWWSPDPREVLLPAEFHCSRSLATELRRRPVTARWDEDFIAVIDACAAPRIHSPGTWITAEMRAAYIALHEQGFAHSLSVWRDGERLGGIYGVQLGRVFFGESMYSAQTNGSKLALAKLVERCRSVGIELVDCQMHTPHLRSLGSRALPRAEFAQLLAQYCDASLL